MGNEYDEKIEVLRMELNECNAELEAARKYCKSLYDRKNCIQRKLNRALEDKRKLSEYFNPMTDTEIIAVILSDGSISGIKL